MRTTVDLPDDLHQVVLQKARDDRTSLSRTVAELVRAGLQPPRQPEDLEIDPLTGVALFRTGRVITPEEVADFLDDV